MLHCSLSIFIWQIHLESMLEIISTKLPLIYIRQRKSTQDGNLGDGNLVDKVHFSVLSDYCSSFDISITNNECLSSTVTILLFRGNYSMLHHVHYCFTILVT